jgi:hypothetical protein
MTSPLLTIAIPTYNRADCLERLLDTLLVELRGLEGRVSVVVSDNASTDRTPAVVAAFAAQWPGVQAVRHAENIGMDGNFIGCVERVDGQHFWLMGDDDLPRAGVVHALLALLERDSPDLVYMDSRWLREIADNDPTRPVESLKGMRLGQLAFARRVHVWTTYLSGMVVRTTPLLRDPARLRRHAGTQVSQLAWVLEALRDGRRFVHVTTPCILATEGNTGGYKVLKVFGQHVPAIMRETLPGPVARAMLRRMAVTYLPNLLLGLREARLGRFEQEDAAVLLRPEFGGMLAFRWLLVPIGDGRPAAARRAVWLGRQAHRALRVHDRIAERVSGAASAL